MLLRGDAFLREARAEGRAVPAFVTYNLEQVQGVVAAGEALDRPVMIIAGSSAFAYAGRSTLARLALDAAAASSVPVGVHLDHCRSVEEIEFCLDQGYSSVMFDGSHLPYDENVATTARVVESAHRVGAWVEAELVGIAGDEDVSTDAVATAMTDPATAAQFVDATGVDALAVAVGNVHGFTSRAPRIDLERLARIAERVAVPLVLHGASGLDDDVLARCVASGVAKVNVNAELRRAYLDAFVAQPDALAAGDLVACLRYARDAVAQSATRIIRALDHSARGE